MKLFFALALLLSLNTYADEASMKFPTGVASAEIYWGTSEDTGEDILVANLKFDPNKKAPLCERISFIQTAQVETAPGKDYEWNEAEGQANRNFIRTKLAPGIERGFFIDHNAIKCQLGSKCSPYYRDSWPNVDYSQDGYVRPGSMTHASLHDAPYGWTNFEQIRLEACAYCINPGSAIPMGCMKWGGYWGMTGPKKILPISFHERPTQTFLTALKAFVNFYDKKIIFY